MGAGPLHRAQLAGDCVRLEYRDGDGDEALGEFPAALQGRRLWCLVWEGEGGRLAAARDLLRWRRDAGGSFWPRE